jgi:hypothetical protein
MWEGPTHRASLPLPVESGCIHSQAHIKVFITSKFHHSKLQCPKFLLGLHDAGKFDKTLVT